MKKLLVACALSAAAIAPATASAVEPDRADFKNAAKFCKAYKAGAGSNNFATMFGTKKNAYGKCVSSTAKKTATEDAAQEKAAKTNAAKECKAVKEAGGPKNAYGKCVSEKAKQHKAAADKEDKAEQEDRINAAKTCKTAKMTDPSFAGTYGTGRNAFGKCVSTTAKEMAEERKAESAA